MKIQPHIIEQIQQLAGTMCDEDLAKKFDVSISTARRYRANAGKPPVLKRRGLPKDKTDAIYKDLGKMTDMAVAIKHGVSKPCIQGRRSRAGIPPFIDPLARKVRSTTPKEIIARGYSSLQVADYWEENRVIDQLMMKWGRPC